MNGVSLLIALAAWGVDVGWESTPDNKLVYTIRIESVLLEQLRKGSAIESQVEAKDRNLRNFRVAMGPKSLTERPPSATNNEVQYGWRPNDRGGLDYYVQMSPERLETLAKGIPIDCDVSPQVPSVERIYVFVGTAVLPREGGSAASGALAGAAVQPLTNAATGPTQGASPASGVDSRLSAPQLPNSAFGSQNNTASNLPNSALGSPPATNTYASANSYSNTLTPPNANRWSSETPTSPLLQGVQPPSGYNAAAQDAYGPVRAGTLPVPEVRRDEPRYQDPYGYRDDRAVGRNENLPRQTATDTALAHQLPPPPSQQPAPHATYPSYAPAQQPPPATAPVTASKEVVQEVKPWTPLVLTTLALFASIGANAYLGWLAWSFFWRYQDTASGLARARSTASSLRQAA